MPETSREARIHQVHVSQDGPDEGAFLGAVFIELGRRYDDAHRDESRTAVLRRTPELLATLGYLQGRAGNVAADCLVHAELQQLSAERYEPSGRLAQVHVEAPAARTDGR